MNGVDIVAEKLDKVITLYPAEYNDSNINATINSKLLTILHL